jgi:hypothetical protein
MDPCGLANIWFLKFPPVLMQPFPELPGYFPFYIPFPDIRPFIIGFFSLTKPQFHLNPALFKIKRKGNQGITLFIDLAAYPFYFIFVEEQPLFSVRIVVKNGGIRIFRYPEGTEPDFSPGYFGPGVGEGYFSVPEGLNLGSQKLYTTFVLIIHRIIVAGLAVQGDDLNPFTHDSPRGATTGLKETKGEQDEGGREALVSALMERGSLIQEPPFTGLSGEPMSRITSIFAGKKLKGTKGSPHHSHSPPGISRESSPCRLSSAAYSHSASVGSRTS